MSCIAAYALHCNHMMGEVSALFIECIRTEYIVFIAVFLLLLYFIFALSLNTKHTYTHLQWYDRAKDGWIGRMRVGD